MIRDDRPENDDMSRYLPLKPVELMVLMVLAAACIVVWSVAFPPAQAKAGSFVIPAWAFDHGNGRIYASPEKYADAGPVVGSGQRQPWGWSVEYDIDSPIEAQYTIQICYASAEPRPGPSNRRLKLSSPRNARTWPTFVLVSTKACRASWPNRSGNRISVPLNSTPNPAQRR